MFIFEQKIVSMATNGKKVKYKIYTSPSSFVNGCHYTRSNGPSSIDYQTCAWNIKYVETGVKIGFFKGTQHRNPIQFKVLIFLYLIYVKWL